MSDCISLKDCINESDSLHVERVGNSVMCDTIDSCVDVCIEKVKVREVTDTSLTEQIVMPKGNVDVNCSNLKQNRWSNCGFLIIWTCFC